MPPKGKRPQAADKGKRGEEERESPLQAVILADPFETRFRPFTLEKPRCLLPLANIPLIEYTFEFLQNAGVEEVFVYCGAHKDQVEDYIKASKWNPPSYAFSKLELLQSTSNSIGDAMRDLDSRGILVGDFLLVYGDVVSMAPLAPALAEHRARRAKDKDAIMTMVLREAGARHRTLAQDVKPIFIIEPSTDRCLHFEQMPNPAGTHHYSIDPDILSNFAEFEQRADLIDCGIDICTPDVLALWSDNFDFQAPRKHFLHSVLKDYELNGKKIYTHILTNGYAARVRNLKAYDSVSKDIVSRWAYPLCPDTNLLPSQNYRRQGDNIYKEDSVTLARDCIIKPRTVIGRGTEVGERSVISNSVIGRHCQIGRDVTISGTYIWDNSIIGDGCTVRECIIASDASLGERCKVEPGALISYGVKIADDMTIRGDHRITKARRKRDVGEEVEEGESNPAVVGKGGKGFEFYDEDEEDEEEMVQGLVSNFYNLHNLSAESISTLGLGSEDEYEAARNQGRAAADSFVSIGSQDSCASQHAANFDHDATASIYDSLVESHESANIQLELTALRMSTNASDHQVRRAIVVAFAKRTTQLIKSGSSIRDAVAQVFGHYKDLVDRSIFDKAQANKVDQVDFMLLLQNELLHRESGDVILLTAATKLIELDSIQEEGMQQWWEDERSTETEELRRVRERTRQLIDYLNESSEEESSEEDSSDDEESE
ncbi:translation initiation factor eIF-2B subunit epsilon [Westerdykella ornata]|uniref:Mannose-1-phosphate guanyltransferase n=1 Tax=Westerdykella ornata TaxID=318751 RepID=A0A6A6J6W2_WESOR|nr:translation initiation factor eIF-2B subunit epsilon [Westerdykella ornata]KAF2272152.1 translation initiation factor eIF-2B subunit epsilon [Westerdykella ornata]